MVGTRPRQQLTKARIAYNWSQQEVADRIGTTVVNVSRWEHGHTKPGPYFRRKLCELFALSEQELDLPAPRVIPPASDYPILDADIPRQSAIPLVGRDELFNQLRQRLITSSGNRITALSGLPGVGKTALAIHLCYDREIRAHFSGGILWSALGSDADVPGHLRRWGEMLGLSEMALLQEQDDLFLALRYAIGTRRMLLVIDDVWRLEDALTLKVGGDHCTHLVTTRFPTIATSTAFFPSLNGATGLHELEEDEGFMLLRMLAPTVIEREEQKARELVHAVGGLPLALILLGNNLRMHGYGGQPRRIHDALARLSHAQDRLLLSEVYAPVERHPSLLKGEPLSLESVFAVTDRSLDEEVRETFYALSVFPARPNTFSEVAALAVGNCAVETLDTLCDAGFLEGSGPDRYSMHQAIADYARLQTQGVERAAGERLAVYYANFAETHQGDYEALGQERENILAALEAAHTLHVGRALVRCACAAAPFLLARGLSEVAEWHLERAQGTAVGLGDRYGRLACLLYLGRIAQERGEYGQAVSMYHEGLILAREIGDREGMIELLETLESVAPRRRDAAGPEQRLLEGPERAR